MTQRRINLYHNLSVMLAAGVSVVRALQTVPKGGRIGRVFQQIAASVADSQSLAEAVEHHKSSFDPLDVALIRIGEDTGQLPEMFEMLSEWYAFCQRLRRIIGSGLMLPVVMIHLLALMAPVPSFAMGGWDVGLYIQSAIGILLLFYIPAAVVLGVIYLTPRRGLLRTLLDTFVLAVPVLGPAVRDVALSRYCRIFAIGLKAGLPIRRAADLAAQVAGNTVIRRAVAGGIDAVKRGEEISTGFSSRRLPEEFIAVWQVGEETGDLDESTERLGRIYAENAQRRFQALAVWTPRMVYAIVAAVMAWHIIKSYMTLYGDLYNF